MNVSFEEGVERRSVRWGRRRGSGLRAGCWREWRSGLRMLEKRNVERVRSGVCRRDSMLVGNGDW